MSTETTAPRTETADRSFVPEELAEIVFVVPVVTGAALVLLGSLFLAVASPATGSLLYGAVASAVVGSLVGGFVGVVALLVASVIAPWFGWMPEIGTVLGR